MTGTSTVEKQKIPEIKTPEELIKRLEDKSEKTLAARVRAIETTVTGNAESKWKKLQSELPDAEKQQIETVLGTESPEIGNHLRTAVGVVAGTAGVATVIDQLDGSIESTGFGKLGIKESIKEWIKETLTEELPQDADFFDKFMHKIQFMFLAPFAKMYGIEIPKKGTGIVTKMEGKAEEANGKIADIKENASESMSNTAFDLLARGIVALFPENERKKYSPEAQGLAPSAIIVLRKHSYANIENLYERNKSNPKQLVSDLGLHDTPPDALDLAVRSLLKNKDIFASYFSKDEKKHNWKEYSLEELLKVAGSEFAMIVKVSSIETADEAKQWLAHLVHPNPKGDSDSVESFHMKLNAVKTRFKGLDLKVLESLESVNPSIITNDYLESKGLNGQEKEFILKTLVPFREKFLGMLGNKAVNFGVDNDTGAKMRNIFEGKDGNKGLGMGEILNIFIRTGGHMNFEEMNGFEHVMLYQLILGYLVKHDKDNTTGPEYITRIIRAGLAGDTPPQVKKVFEVLGNASEQVMIGTLETVWGGFRGVYEGLSPSAKAAMIVAGGMFVYLLRVLFIGKVAIIAMGGAALISGLFSSAAASIFDPKTKQELENKAKEIK